MTCVVCKFCGYDFRDGKQFFCAWDKSSTNADRECNLHIPIDSEGEEFHFVILEANKE